MFYICRILAATKMEHSYSRDWKTGPDEENSTLPTRTLMIHRPPQCPSCHIHPSDEASIVCFSVLWHYLII